MELWEQIASNMGHRGGGSSGRHGGNAPSATDWRTRIYRKLDGTGGEILAAVGNGLIPTPDALRRWLYQYGIVMDRGECEAEYARLMMDAPAGITPGLWQV